MASSNRQSIRKRVREVVETHEIATVEDVVVDISRDVSIDQAEVVEELDELERHGFVYLVDRGDETEVRLP